MELKAARKCATKRIAIGEHFGATMLASLFLQAGLDNELDGFAYAARLLSEDAFKNDVIFFNCRLAVCCNRRLVSNEAQLS